MEQLLGYQGLRHGENLAGEGVEQKGAAVGARQYLLRSQRGHPEYEGVTVPSLWRQAIINHSVNILRND